MTLRLNVQLVFTQILNIVLLLAKPTVVIVIVQRPYCSYCSTVVIVQNDPQLSTQTRFFCDFEIHFAIFSGFKTIPSVFETIPSDFGRFAHQIRRKFKGCPPQPA